MVKCYLAVLKVKFMNCNRSFTAAALRTVNETQGHPRTQLMRKVGKCIHRVLIMRQCARDSVNPLVLQVVRTYTTTRRALHTVDKKVQTTTGNNMYTRMLFFMVCCAVCLSLMAIIQD